VKLSYLIKIDTGKFNLTDPNIWIKDGVIQLSTDGVGVDPYTDIDTGGKIGGITYTNVITKEGIRDAGSRIDIDLGGEFATLNGFSFTVKNKSEDGVLFSTKAESYGINFTGSKVNLFLFDRTNNILYSRWSGVIETPVFDERVFTLSCVDEFMLGESQLPPQLIGKVNYPNAPDS